MSHFPSRWTGERSGFFSTGRYLVGQTVGVVALIILNTAGLIGHWDPFPFVLLNLVFAIQAAYAAPFILRAQNRQPFRDQASIERGREVATWPQAQTEALAREIAAIRVRLAQAATIRDLDDSVSRLETLITGQPFKPGS